MESGPTQRLAWWWSGVIARRPRIVLLAAVLLTVLSGVVTATKLTFQSDRNDLLSASLPWNQRFIAYQKKFHGDDDLIGVVVVPESPRGRIEAQGFTRELARQVAALPGVLGVQSGFDEREASARALRVLPKADFDRRLAEIAGSRSVLAAGGLPALIGAAAAELAKFGEGLDGAAVGTASGDVLRDLARLDGLVGVAEDALLGRDCAAALRAVESADASSWRFLESDDGKLLFLRIRVQPDTEALDSGTMAISGIRNLLATLHQQHPTIEAGLAGVPVLESDETEISTRDSTRCSIVSIVAVILLLAAAHGGWRLTVMAMVALILGMVWTFGFLTVAIGHLQILSVAFTSILVGLGIDYAIYIGTRYEVARARHAAGVDGFRSALADTLRSAGPGVITGAVTPALAFATLMFTDFTGMAEMGLIAGVGILLCLAATLTAFLAMLRLFTPEAEHVVATEKSHVRFFSDRWIGPFTRRPRTTLIVAAILGLAAMPSLFRVRYDYNLINLEAEGTSSVIWQERILQHTTEAVWNGASVVPDLATARTRAAAFRRLGSVGDLGGIGLLFPVDEQQKLEAMAGVRAELQRIPRPAVLAVGAGSLQVGVTGLRFALGVALRGRDLADSPEIKSALDGLVARLDRVATAMRTTPQSDLDARAATLQKVFEAWQSSVRDRVATALDSAPLTPEDLPEVFRDDCVAADGSLLLKVYPSGDVWKPAELSRFAAEARGVDPEFTGPPIQIYDSTQLIKGCFTRAGIYAFIAVLLTLILNFRSLVDAALALLPVGVAFLITFGVMDLCNEPVNPANIIILPLLFGIGVESGVHMINRFRLDPGMNPPGLAGGTGKGVVLATLTTIFGFGALLAAHHRGIRSLGFVVSVGMVATLAACLTLMPALLTLRRRMAQNRP